MWEAQVESLPREELERQALEGLRRTLRHVLANPAWRRRLAGAEPGDIRTAADWSRLPFLTKDELRDAYPFGLACVEPERVVRIHMSSGTTGNPVLNPYTRADIDQWASVMARCYVAAGVGARDVIQITASFGLFTGGFGFHYGAERIGAMVIPAGAGRTSLQLQVMRDLGATVLTGISTYPLRILEVAREEQFDLDSLRLRVAILGAEMWSDDLRRLIERELRVATFDIVGMTETGGPGLGIDCQAREGIHVWEDHYFCEVVDPETGRPRADGEEGELAGEHAHPRGAAADPLPHARSHAGAEPRALRLRPHPPAPGPPPRADRRHGDLPRGQLLPPAGRVADSQAARRRPRVPDRPRPGSRRQRPAGPPHRGS